MSEEIKLKIRRDIKIRLEESNKKSDQRRAAVRLIATVPVYNDESEEFTLAYFGADGNLSVSQYAAEQAGLDLEVDDSV